MIKLAPTRKSCLVKTVSFSETVSEQTLPAVPPPVRPRPTDEGDYVERSVNHEDGRQPRMRLRAPYFNSASDISRMNHETRQGARLTKPLSPEQERESEKKQAKYNKFGKVVLCVDDLPEDQDGDEFEYIGVYKCGNCTVGFAPVKKKKLMFVTLTERALNLHDSEKAYRCGKAAKRVIDLAIAFNAHGDHFDAKMKKCLCLMTPDETICMRPEGGIATIEGWRRALVKAIHEARRSKMDRIPRPEDIFDAVYDIIVCPNMKNEPKYQDSRKEHGFTNISNVIQELMGRRRLCLYPNTLAICGIYIEPTCYGLPAAGFPCFRASNMFILERSTIAFYGHCDNYFYIRIGKGSPYRGYEILFSVESAEVCKEISSRLNFLAERDIENRKVEMSSDLHGMESLSVPSPLSHRTKYSLDSPILTAKDRRLLLARDCLSFASIEKDDSAPSSPFANYCRPRGSLGNFQVDYLSRLEQPRGSIHSLGNIPVERSKTKILCAAFDFFSIFLKRLSLHDF
uniref:Uncharacterized protein n=1 Tax=Caenorhabditis japonica TaxID=281687 RepID=A0A8R1I4X9_CAEJA